MTPGDSDEFPVSIQDGEFVSVRITVEAGYEAGRSDKEPTLTISSDATIQPVTGFEKREFGLNEYAYALRNKFAGKSAIVNVYASETGDFCIDLAGQQKGAYDYTISIQRNEQFATPTPTPTVTPTQTATPSPTATPTGTTVVAADPDRTATQTPPPTTDVDEGGSGIRTATEDNDADNDGVPDDDDFAPDNPNVQDPRDAPDTSGGAGPGFGIVAVALALGLVVLGRRRV